MDILILPVNTILFQEKERQRTSYDKQKLIDLATNIKDDRLLHPPTIISNENRTLVCGGRRTKSLQFLAEKGVAIRFNGELLPVGYAPFVIAGTDDPIALKWIELKENTLRENLSWHDEERALAEIDRLLKEINEAEGKTDPIPLTVFAAAAETSTKTASINRNIASHLEDPEVAKAKTKKEALKIIEKKRTQEHLATKAAETKLTSNDHQIAKGDCRELIKKIPSGIIRCIPTDPPYGIDMHKDQSWDGTYHDYDDSEEYALSLIRDLLPEFDRVTLPQAHVYLFCDYAKIEKIRSIVNSYRKDATGNVVILNEKTCLEIQLGLRKPTKQWEETQPVFVTMPYPFVWNKGNVAAYPRAEHWPRKSAEYILYLIKGDHKQTKLDLCVININQLQIQDHPAGKPEELYEHLILRSTEPGDVILDTFAGQGNVLRAAHKNKRKSISFELSDEYWPLLARAKREVDGVE